MRRAHDAAGRKRLPRCPCGKATYASVSAAGKDRKRYDLNRIYRCPEFGRIHLTSTEDRPIKRGTNTIEYRERHTVSTTCPIRPRDSVGHDGGTCAHPLHWSDRDPDRPYYPNVSVMLTGQDGNALLIMGRVSSALNRQARATRPVINAFRAEFTGAPDYDAALRVAMRWVEVE